MSVTSTIGFGLVLFAPLGAAGIGIGIVAMLTGQVLGGAMGALTAGTRGLSMGTTSALTLLLAGLVHSVVGDHPGPEAIGIALAVVAMTTMLCGLLLALFALLGAGKVIPLVPYPVLAGIVNGTAVLLIISMMRRALGPGPGDMPGLWLPVAPLVTVVVIVVMYVRIPRRLAQIPAVLLAVLAGTAVHHLLALAIGLNHAGPMLGVMPSFATGADSFRQALDALRQIDPMAFATLVAPVALTMAVVAMIETLRAFRRCKTRWAAWHIRAGI